MLINNNSLFILGVTGGMGCGKSTACNIFKNLGAEVFQADQIAKDILSSNKEVKEKVIELLGKEAYHKTGEPNKLFIADAIFNK